MRSCPRLKTATSDILGAAEKIQEFAWTLREQGVDNDSCDALDMEATNIYMACSFQDLTGANASARLSMPCGMLKAASIPWSISGALKLTRSTSIIPTPRHTTRVRDKHLLNGPALAGEGV